MAEDYFGPDVAARYDSTSADLFDASVVGPAVELLAALAAGGAALELGIGTGRLALPLQAAGVTVHGIDLSATMLEQLRLKPGAERIGLTHGDFARTRAPGSYVLAYLAFNTIMNLTTQDEQVACFENVARHLEPGGRFVIEVNVPDLQRLPAGEIYRPFAVRHDRLGFDEYDVVTQKQTSHHIRLQDGNAEMRSIPFRYVWPSELDLMARLAGMTLQARWGAWNRAPFTSDSREHISVWQKPY